MTSYVVFKWNKEGYSQKGSILQCYSLHSPLTRDSRLFLDLVLVHAYWCFGFMGFSTAQARIYRK